MRIFLSISILLLFQSSWAGKIEKGFSALQIYNYFEAKRLFEEAEEKHPVAAAYGLSIIYQRDDNPFTNIDSAYCKIVRAIDGFSSVDSKLRGKYALLGLDSLSLLGQRDLISADMYKLAVSENLIASFQRYSEMHPWSVYRDSAIHFRDSLAFEQAILTGKSAGFEQFLKTYPNSTFSKEAQSSFDRLLYVENTATDNFVDYITFLEKFPESPYRPDAEDRIYEICTRTATTEAYEHFIRDFPSNHNVKNAWRKLLNAHLQKEYSLESLEDFKATFPDYPFLHELEAQISVAGIDVYPVLQNGMWGFMSEDNVVRIEFIYEEVARFSEGLAAIRTEKKYGYIDNLGKIVIAEQFDDALDFSEGHAVVEVNEKWGMINRSGEFVIPPVHENLGSLKNGLIYFEQDGLYGYFDEKGTVRLKAQFSDANDFEAGRAVVANESGYGVIDEYGTVFVPLQFENIEFYGTGLYKAKLRSNWGILSEQGDTLVPFIYDYIGELQSNRALVEAGGQFNYISPDGKTILTTWVTSYPECRQLAEFQNGYARVKFDKGFNLLDTTGKKLFAKDQLNIGQYGDPIAVLKGKHWGYVGKTGSTVIPNTFSMAKSFVGNFAAAGSEPLWGLIDKKGKYVIEPYFEEISMLNDSLWIARSRGNYGILKTNGDTLLNFSYLSVEPVSSGLLELEQNGALYYYNLKQNTLIRKEE